MIIHRDDFPGNVMVDFEARTVLPCTHDIDFMWNGCWDEATDQRELAYVGGLEGWWGGKVGIEKSPEYKLNPLTPLFPFEPAASITSRAAASTAIASSSWTAGWPSSSRTGSHRFRAYAKIGFEAYCSHIQIRNIKIWRLAWESVEASYIPEFC